MRPILERLILSDLSEANDPFFLNHHGVEAILYFGQGGMFPEDIKLYHRNTPKESGLEATQLRDGIEFLRESLRAGRRVLAVGPTGATIVAAYLTEMGFSGAQALQMVSEGRGQAPRPQEQTLDEHAADMERRRSVNLHKAAKA